MKEIVFSDDKDEMVAGKEIDAAEQSNVRYQHDSWINEQLDPIRVPIEARIPHDVVIRMRSIEKLMAQNAMASQEFGMYLKGSITDEGILNVGLDYYVPKQKVTGASIDFEESIPDNSYNGVIHRHPCGCKSFSGTDYSYINKNFEFSLLYVDNEIGMGIINLQCKTFRVQLPLKINIIYPVFNNDFSSIIEKIHKYDPPKVSLGERYIGKKYTGGFLPGLSIDDGSRDDGHLLFDEPEREEENSGTYRCDYCEHIQQIDDFPHKCTGCGEMLEVDDVEEIDVIDPNNMYECKLCGETQEISTFPHQCTGCGKELDQTNVNFIDDLNSSEQDETKNE